ncbi:MAG: hypothetical protein ACQER9_01765 [Nanobdellota archaeon]
MATLEKLLPATYGFKEESLLVGVENYRKEFMIAQMAVVIAHRAFCRENGQSNPDMTYSDQMNSPSSYFAKALNMAFRCENPDNYAVPLEEMDHSLNDTEKNQLEVTKMRCENNQTLADIIPEDNKRKQFVEKHVNPFYDGRIILGCMLSLMDDDGKLPEYAEHYKEFFSNNYQEAA